MLNIHTTAAQRTGPNRTWVKKCFNELYKLWCWRNNAEDVDQCDLEQDFGPVQPGSVEAGFTDLTQTAAKQKKKSLKKLDFAIDTVYIWYLLNIKYNIFITKYYLVIKMSKILEIYWLKM